MKKILFPLLILGIVLTMSDCKDNETNEPQRFTITYFSEGHDSGEVPVDTNTYTEIDEIELIPGNIDALGLSTKEKEDFINILREMGMTPGTLKKEGHNTCSWDLREAKSYNTVYSDIYINIDENTRYFPGGIRYIKINKNITIYAEWEH